MVKADENVAIVPERPKVSAVTWAKKVSTNSKNISLVGSFLKVVILLVITADNKPAIIPIAKLPRVTRKKSKIP